MNKLILSVGFAVALFFSTAIILAQEQAPAPTIKEGDTWQFNISRRGRLPVRQIKTTECTNYLLRKEL